MITKCPHCKTKFRGHDDWKGRKTKCPKCKEMFTITEFTGESVPQADKPNIGKKELEFCASCRRTIGRLEQAHVFKGLIVCSECDKKMRSESGAVQVASAATGSLAERAVAGPLVVYAGFWRRLGAWFIDGISVRIVLSIMAYIEPAEVVEGTKAFTGLALAITYYVIMESSSLQATFGKMALGIVVTDMNGGRVSLGRATGRQLAKIVSALALFIGFIMAGFTEKKQALHDMIAGCLVVRKQ